MGIATSYLPLQPKSAIFFWGGGGILEKCG